MGHTHHSISAYLRDVRAETITFNYSRHYYEAGERPPGLHVGVPPKPNHFVGREELVAEIALRLTGGDTFAIAADGPPGVGKTTLAVALAYRRDVLDHFSDGVLWGGLGLQPNVMAILATWAAALGEDVLDAKTTTLRAQRVRDVIGQRKLLLVIDDAWPSADAAVLLKCGGPNCAHFLTTRHEDVAEAFAGTKGTVGVRELAPSDALQLLRALAPEASEAHPLAAERVVESVGYLPLAIELAGGYISAPENRRTLTSQESAFARLADAGERLQQTSRRLGDARDTAMSLRETILLSLEGVSAAVVNAFSALAAFSPKPETFGLDAAVAVTGAPPEVLSVLITRRLIDRDDTGLSLHRTIADVAWETCSAEAINRHAEYYLGHVHAAGESLEAIDAVYGQVKQAFARIPDSEPVAVLAATAALRGYQTVRGFLGDQLVWSDRELAAAGALDDKRHFANALNSRGSLHDQLGESAHALDYYSKALPVACAAGAREIEAAILNNIGGAYLLMGELERALEFLGQALPLSAAVGDQLGHAAVLNNIGRAYYHMANLELALEHYEQALPIARAQGYHMSEAGLLRNIANIHDLRGHSFRALEYHEQAISLFRAVGSPLVQAMALTDIAGVYYELEDWERALDATEQALLIMCRERNRDGEVQTRRNLAAIHREAGRLETAAEELRKVVALESTLQLPSVEESRWMLRQVEAELADEQRARAPDSVIDWLGRIFLPK